MTNDELAFHPGDQVELKSGSPPMTIDSFDTFRGKYLCNWFAGSKLQSGFFTEETLKPAAADEDE